ncbi:hypothetical protein MJD09_24350, partial [bacterium]|nr:hypothetical protein [bacterium]
MLASATEESITIDGNVNGLISSTPVADQDATVTDSWTVQGAAQLQSESVSSPLDTVVVGQQNTISVRVSNPAPAAHASVVIDNILLKFLKDGITDRSSDFLFSPLAGNPVSIQAGQDTVFNFAVNVTSSADTGNYVVDVEVSGHDTNSVTLALNDPSATTTLDWHVKGAPTLQILSLTAQPNQAFVAGQTVPWFVEMAVRNNGPDDIALSFQSTSTFVRFTIGVDVTGEYTILQPSQLKSAGTSTLVGGATDTLEFTVQQTGTTTGTAAISGRVGGTVVASGGAISDDTNDGGTGVVFIRSADATVFVAATNPVTPNPNTTDEFGFANTDQSFQIDVLVKNDLDEPVENVQVRLNSNTTLSTITQDPVFIPEIVASGTDTAKFTVIASSSPNLSGEIFTAIIESATGKQSQQPAQVGIPLDDNVNIRIQAPALLSVDLTVDRFQTTSSTFDVLATVSNLGQAEVDPSGMLRLDVPLTYTIQAATPAVQTFTVDDPVLWQVVAPASATILDTFVISFDQSPIELNTGSLAALSAPADSEEVVTTQTDLVIQNFAIIDPAGATDDTLSTEQDFTIEVDLSVSFNIDSVRADLTRPGDDYTFVTGSSSSALLLPGQETATWRLTVPD